MGYEDATATKLLATNCLCCGRPLLDAKSVEIGIGPDCRAKHGYDIAATDEQRTEANKLVHAAATAVDAFTVLTICDDLAKLGFQALAAKVQDRFVQVTITTHEGGMLLVNTSYNASVTPAFNADIKRIPGRKPVMSKGTGRGGKDEWKGWAIPANQRAALWNALQAHYPGAAGIGPKGAFQVKLAA